jgi:hypothetical protein
MITVTVNGLPISQYQTTCHEQRLMTDEEHQRRIVRSVQRWTAKRIRNHSGGRSKPGRVIFHQEVASA